MAQNQVQATGGNLWQYAARYLGDATQASRIATLNNILDPFLVGAGFTLNLPPADSTSGGGLPFGPIIVSSAVAAQTAPSIAFAIGVGRIGIDYMA